MKMRNCLASWRFSFHCFKVGNGTKSFTGGVWFNSNRVGLEINFWTWELQMMYETC